MTIIRIGPRGLGPERTQAAARSVAGRRRKDAFCSAAGRYSGPRLWVPETALTAVDLPLRRPSEPGMIRRWR